MAIKTTELPQVSAADDFIVNSGGKTSRMSAATLAASMQADIASATLPVVLLAENSWGYEDPTDTSKWLSTPLKGQLNAAFGTRWVLRNVSDGGKSIGVTTDAERSTVQLPANLGIGGVTVVIGRNPLNDISQGRTALQILSDISTCRTAAVVAGAVYLQPNCPPFNNPNGANFYDATTRAVADAVNSGLAAIVGANNVINLWGQFNDAASDGSMLAAYRLSANDWYHLNGAGAAIYAGLIVNNAAFQSAMAAPAITTTARSLVASLDPGAVWYSKGVVAGRVGGQVGVFTAYHANTILDDQIAYFAAQPNDKGAGWGWGSTFNGGLSFWRIVGAKALRLFIAGVATAWSILTTKFSVQADGINTRFSGTTFGGNVGAALDVRIDSGTSVGLTAYKNGGTGFGDFDLDAGSIQIKIGGTARLVINSDSTIGLPGLPFYASNTAAVAAIGLGKLFFNSTTTAVDYSR